MRAPDVRSRQRTGSTGVVLYVEQAVLYPLYHSGNREVVGNPLLGVGPQLCSEHRVDQTSEHGGDSGRGLSRDVETSYPIYDDLGEPPGSCRYNWHPKEAGLCGDEPERLLGSRRNHQHVDLRIDRAAVLHKSMVDEADPSLPGHGRQTVDVRARPPAEDVTYDRHPFQGHKPECLNEVIVPLPLSDLPDDAHAERRSFLSRTLLTTGDSDLESHPVVHDAHVAEAASLKSIGNILGDSNSGGQAT